jgi:hypothetical protein
VLDGVRDAGIEKVALFVEMKRSCIELTALVFEGAAALVSWL